jgi:hypothetical protein
MRMQMSIFLHTVPKGVGFFIAEMFHYMAFKILLQKITLTYKGKSEKQCCEYEMFIRILIFPSRIPDPESNRQRIQGQKDTGSRDPDPQRRILVFLTQKIATKFSEVWSWMFIPYPGPDFFTCRTSDLAPSRCQKRTGSRIRNTD